MDPTGQYFLVIGGENLIDSHTVDELLKEDITERGYNGNMDL